MAGLLAERLAKLVSKAKGSEFWISKTIVSSTLLTTAQDLTGTATGRLYVKQIIVKSDATGLVGPTNFEILSNNAKGLVNIFVETVANLASAVKTHVLNGAGINADTTTVDGVASVTAVPTILEAGKKLQYIGTGSAGTGAGTVDVFVLLQRIDEGAELSVA